MHISIAVRGHPTKLLQGVLQLTNEGIQNVNGMRIQLFKRNDPHNPLTTVVGRPEMDPVFRHDKFGIWSFDLHPFMSSL